MAERLAMSVCVSVRVLQVISKTTGTIFISFGSNIGSDAGVVLGYFLLLSIFNTAVKNRYFYFFLHIYVLIIKQSFQRAVLLQDTRNFEDMFSSRYQMETKNLVQSFPYLAVKNR